MNLDIKTVILFCSVGILFLGLCFYIISSGRLGKIWEFEQWAFSTLIQSIGWILISTTLNDGSYLIYVSIGNGCLILSQAIVFNILSQLQSIRVNRYYAYLYTGLGWIAFGYFGIINSLFTVKLIFAISISFIQLSTSIILFISKKRTTIHTFLSFVYAICAIAIFVRLFANIDEVYFIVFLFTEIFLPFGFLLLCIDSFIRRKEIADDNIIKLSMGIEQSPVSIVITDINGNIEYINPFFTAITGYSQDEVLGKTPRILKSGYTSSDEYKEIWNKLYTGEKWKGIFQNKKKNGELYWEATSISPLKNHTGEITHFISIKENITSQILAERRLAESEERYRLLMQTSMDLIHITDIHGKLLDYNSAFLKHLGYTVEEAEKLKVRDWDAKWSEIEIKEIIQTLLEKPLLFETVHKRKDGVLRFVEINAIAVEIRGEYFLYASGRDITERKQNEIALKESEEKFKSFFKKNEATFLMLDPVNGNILDANTAAENYYGYSLVELKSMRISEINTLSPEEIKIEMQNAIYFKRNYFNFKHRLKSGEIKEVEVYSTPITVSQKIILFSIVHDVTERKKAEKLLRESEARLKLALEGAKEGTWDWNIETGYVTFDDYWAEMLGYKLTEISPAVSSWENLLHPDDKDVALNVLKKHLEGETDTYQVEHRMKTKSGNWKWILGHGKVIERNNNGEPLRAIGTHVDIDIYKIAHEKLKLLSDELKNSSATKDKFFSIISHDLRGPIGNINSLLEFITENKEKIPKEEFDEMLLIVKTSAKNIFILLENLLVWSRSQRGLIKFSPFKYNLHDLIKSNLNLFSISAKSKNISLVNQVGKDVFAYFDFEMIDTVIRNLISNSIKYTKEDGEIIISVKELPDAIEIKIKDDGIGMCDEIKESLFKLDVKQPSVQGTNGEKGSGLGLILCKEFIDKHNGEINLKSELGIGTEFIIKLPSAK